jgi:hypothetical protein
MNNPGQGQLAGPARARSALMFILPGLLLLSLYAAAGEHLFDVTFSSYLHTYSFQLKNVLFLLPALMAFSCSLSLIVLPVFKKTYAFVMAVRPGVFVFAVFCLFVPTASAVCLVVLEGIPHVQDSIAQLFQARVFASGTIFLPSPEHPHFFDMQFVIDNGEIRYGKYLFGQSLFLLIGVLIGVPWIINPLAGGLTIILTYVLAREVLDEKTARLTVLLLLVSPFYMFMHASFMSHAPHLLLVTACLLATVKACISDRLRYFFIAGLLFGLAVNVKPFDSVLFLMPFFIYGLAVRMGKHGALGKALVFLLPFCACALGLLVYNKMLTGDYSTTGYALYAPHSGLGFGAHMGEETFRGDGTVPGHTPLQGLKGSAKLLVALADDLFGWPDLSLLFACMLFIFFRTNRWERLMAASCLCIVAGYFFYWGTPYSICFGPRYYFLCVPALAMFTARAVLKTPQLLEYGVLKRLAGKHFHCGAATGICVILLVLLNAAFHVPQAIALYGNSYWNVDKDVVNRVRESNLQNALVFVESEYYREPHSAPDYYNSVFNFNALTLDGPVVYARDFGPAANRLLMEQYPGRDYYLYKTSGELRQLLYKVEAEDW